VTVAEPDWSELDRGYVLALLAERAETCQQCGHPVSECRDKKTAGSWAVVRSTCYPSQVAQAEMENVRKEGRRGVVFATRRNN